MTGFADGALRAGRLIELVVLFVAAPVVISLFSQLLPVVPALWLAALYCGLVLWRDSSFDRRRLWRWDAARRNALLSLAAVIAGVAALFVLAVAYIPDRLFAFPKRRPGFWALVMFLYPILSVYPQGIVYRAFFMHRYRGLFGDGAGMVLASAGAFAFCHVALNNWIAPSMTLVGGVLFARTYLRTKSLAAAWVEHTVLGCAVFTIGWGRYFVGG